jgi:predicted enzyme related to lactoylglutathione lyase
MRKLAIATLALLGACTSMGNLDLSGMSFSHTPLVGKVVWNDLVTEDAAAARRFYGGVFGWTFQQTTSAGGLPYLLARQGGAYVAGIVQTAPRADGKPITRWLPYFSVADVDASVARAQALGGSVALTARTIPIGRVAAVADAENAVIGLVRSSIGDPDDTTTRAAAGRVVWTELPSNNPAQAVKFYGGVTGLNPVEVARRGGTYTMMKSGTVERAGIFKSPDPQWSPSWLTHFGVADLAGAVERAKALGGTVLLPPSPELREGTMAVITDPSGAILVLQKIGA